MTDKPRITLDAKSWQEGFAAGRRGLTGDAKPYPHESERALAWYSGLIEGNTKPLRSGEGGAQ
jgi:hypothetical protein